MGDNLLILAFVVIVIGGIGSVRGAFVAALLVGLVDTLGRSFASDVLRQRAFVLRRQPGGAGARLHADLCADGGGAFLQARRPVSGAGLSDAGCRRLDAHDAARAAGSRASRRAGASVRGARARAASRAPRRRALCARALHALHHLRHRGARARSRARLRRARELRPRGLHRHRRAMRPASSPRAASTTASSGSSSRSPRAASSRSRPARSRSRRAACISS